MAKVRRPETRNLPNKQANLFFIGCEGSETEFQYFQTLSDHFHSSRIKIVPVRPDNHQSSPLGALDALKAKLNSANILDDDEAWLVIDVDGNAKANHIQNLTACLTQARQFRPQINVVLSNPTFEVWLIMHSDTPTLTAGTPSTQYEQLCRQHFAGYQKNQVDRIPVVEKFNQALDYAQRNRRGAQLWPDDPGSDVFKLVQSLISRV